MPEPFEVFPPGTRVVKTKSEPGDTHRDGSPATIVERVGPFPGPDGVPLMGYFVHWDDLPKVPVFIACDRVQRARPEEDTIWQ